MLEESVSSVQNGNGSSSGLTCSVNFTSLHWIITGTVGLMVVEKNSSIFPKLCGLTNVQTNYCTGIFISIHSKRQCYWIFFCPLTPLFLQLYTCLELITKLFFKFETTKNVWIPKIKYKIQMGSGFSSTAPFCVQEFPIPDTNRGLWGESKTLRKKNGQKGKTLRLLSVQTNLLFIRCYYTSHSHLLDWIHAA